MKESRVLLGFDGSIFYVGREIDGVMKDTLGIVFSAGNEDGTQNVNLVNPVPFPYGKNGYPVLPSIDIEKFLYTIDIKEDFDEGDDLIDFYHKSLITVEEDYKKGLDNDIKEEG